MKAWFRGLLVLLALSCAKSEAKRQQEVRSCGVIGSKALEIAECLVARFEWDRTEAQAAAQVRQRELDSTATWLEDSAWQADSLAHRRAVSHCNTGDMADCLLINFGWEERRAVAAADSVWQRDMLKHQKQIRDCARRGMSSAATCLMLTYRWPRRRATAVYDSMLRAHMR